MIKEGNQYYKQLDSLRALAVIMVIIFHWFPASHNLIVPLGSWGVELFFVLSGFLITKILLENRFNAEAENLSRLTVFKNFVIRRSLRIFPLYYLVLIIILVFDKDNITGLKQNMGWYFGYATNFLFFKQGSVYVVGHLWSLAVEEQFYLLWPWLVLFLPRTLLKYFFSLVIIAGLLFRIVFSHIPGMGGYNLLTPACFDLFSVGGFFSYLVLTRENIWKIIRVITIAGIISFLVTIFLLFNNSEKFLPFYRTLDSVFFLALIANAYIGIKGIGGRIADNKVIRYIGRTSYSLYIFHMVTRWLNIILFNILLKQNIKLLTSFITAYYDNAYYLKISLDTIVLLSTSMLSWQFYEKPFNRLKHFFREAKSIKINPIIYVE